MTFRHQMGLRRLPLAEWLQLDEPRLSHQRAEKERLMTSDRGELLITRGVADAACSEVLAEVLAANAAAGNTDLRPDLALHPLDAAARLIREDLLVHLDVDGVLVLKAGSLCFPTRWVLADKIDHPLSEIHEPVPGYDADIGRKVDQFLARLRPDNSVWRQNWSLVSTDELCLPGRHDYLPIGTRPEELWLRTERQTLRRLPRTGAVLFTIGVDVVGLTDVDVGTAATLADEIESLPAAFAGYKGLTEQRTGIVRYLRSR